MGFDDEENGKKITLHGFRGTFRSMIETLDVNNQFSFEIKERALNIAQVIQYEYQIKKAANNMAAFCYCILEYSSRASFRRRSIKAAKSST